VEIHKLKKNAQVKDVLDIEEIKLRPNQDSHAKHGHHKVQNSISINQRSIQIMTYVIITAGTHQKYLEQIRFGAIPLIPRKDGISVSQSRVNHQDHHQQFHGQMVSV